jgi:anti-sigma regulatory factor (Ser/Thr protein kinase)
VVSVAQWLTAPDPGRLRWIRVEEPSAAAAVRNAAQALAGRLSFPPARAELLVLACTEAATNLAKHARQGTLLLQGSYDGGEPGIELVTIDTGPGMPDVRAALRDGHSTAGTLGIGLGAIRRAADFCDVYSLPGRGTTLVARFRPQPAQSGPVQSGAAQSGPVQSGPVQSGPVRWSGLIRPIGGETECGDAYAAVRTGPVMTAMLCDGLGHGPMAAAASREAIRAFREAPGEEPVALLERAHRRMGGTRGGAVAVVRVEGRAVRFAGIGNVAGWIVTGERRQGMVSLPGIAGHQVRKLRHYDYAIEPGAAVVLHSDGLSSRWDIRELPGLAGRDPLVIAAALLSEAGVHRDDAGVLVVKP